MRIGRGVTRTAVTLALVAWTSAVVAQEAPPPASAPSSSAQAQASDPIIVTARPLPEEAQIRALARAITPRTGWDEPLARFTDPVCFGTGGLPRDMLQAIGARLADDAAEAGIRLAGDGCDVNVLLLFVDDGQAEVKQLLKRRPGLFGNMDLSAIRAVIDEPGPVHAWTVSEVRSRDGDRLYLDANGIPTLKVPMASRIVLPTRRDMLTSLILIDRKAVLGRSLQQIADYAAMRTLAAVRPKGATGGDTILTLFDPDAATPPAAMTPFDRGYLKALYEGAGNQRSGSKVGQIVRSIAKDTGATGRKGSPRPPSPSLPK